MGRLANLVPLSMLVVVARSAHSQVLPAGANDSARISAQWVAAAESAFADFPHRAAWQHRFDAARDTIDRVLAWNNTHRQGDASFRMLIPLNRYRNGQATVTAFEQALAANRYGDSALRARALNAAAAAAFRIKDQERTRRWANESIAMFRALHDSSGAGRAYERLVQVALRDGDHRSMRAFADTGQTFCVHDEDCRAYLTNMRGESARVLRQYDSAAIYYATADSLYRHISPTFRLDIAHNLGFTYLALGRTQDARRRFSEGLQHSIAGADVPYTSFLIAGMASAEAVDNNAGLAAKLFGVSDAMLAATGRVADPADAVEYERYRSRARNQLGVLAFNDSVSVGRKLPADSVIAKWR